MNLKGGCIHHDNGFLGACALTESGREKDSDSEKSRLQYRPHQSLSAVHGDVKGM